MKKLNKKFIGFLIWVSIAFLMSTIYLLAAINGNLEQSEETMGPVASVITLSCFLIIPPIIFLIYLIYKKQIIIDINMERAIREEKEAEKDRQLKSFILEINKIISNFSNNADLKTIIKNYIIQKQKIPMRYLEFSILPLQKNQYNYLRFGLLTSIDEDSTYIKFLKNLNTKILFNTDSLASNKHYINAIMDFRDKNYMNYTGEIVEQFKDIESLYKALINQKIIEETQINEQYIYYAFLYFIYDTYKREYCKQTIEQLESYNINKNNDINSIVYNLYKNDFDIDNMVSICWIIDEEKHNFANLLCVDYNIIEKDVNKIIQSIKDKDRINNLLDMNKKKSRFSIADIDLMSGAEFESFVTYLFNQLGYKATNTKLSGDQGIDVIAIKGNTKVAIQCKCFSGSVGNHAVMEAYAGAKYYNADKCIVITNSTFTKSARELASKNGVVLWDRQILKEKLEEI